jgi:hypothetical protein
LTSVSITPASVSGGSSAVLVIALSGPAPKGGASVSLSSINAAFPVPSSVLIPSGSSDSALFVPTKTVTASTSVTVTATYNGGSKTASVTLTPVVLPTLASVAVTPASLTGGSTAVLAITLSGNPPLGGPPVSLSSSSPAFPVPASVPGTPGGGVLLPIRTTAVTVSTSVTVTATYNGVSKTASVTLTPAAKQ